MIVQCCVCKQVRNKGQWRHWTAQIPVQGDVSHGYCPACAAKAFEEIRQLHRKHELKTA